MPARTRAPQSQANAYSQPALKPSVGQRREASEDDFNHDVTSDLYGRLCAIFSSAQASTATHRKLVISLRKLQQSCLNTQNGQKVASRDLLENREEDFNSACLKCITRILLVKKTEAVGDRLARFLGLFLKHACENDSGTQTNDVSDTTVVDETPSLRLVNSVFSLLIQACVSKDKVVRYRATQMIALIINSLDSIDDECYQTLRNTLLKRARDKESMVRVQAVIALGRLAGNEDGEDEAEDSEDEDAHGLTNRLTEILQHDPSSDVRRALLLNLPLTPATLPYLLERARDQDVGTRKALYSRLLPALGDFRHLSLSMREKLLRWGLRDRDENVRKATARLFRERWIEDCRDSSAEVVETAEVRKPTVDVDALTELLERIDIVNSGGESGIAAQAMKEFWEGRPDYEASVEFKDAFWDSLTPESVFIARSWNSAQQAKLEEHHGEMDDDRMPEVTRIAFCLQQHVNKLVEMLRANAAIEEGGMGLETVEEEFIVEQLLHIAKALDYSDEVGRRKMYSLMREILAVAELPDEITSLVVDLLRDLCGSDTSAEKDFSAIVLEAIAEVHDTVLVDRDAETADESFHSARSELSGDSNATEQFAKSGDNSDPQMEEEKAIREIMVNMKCLHIAQCMLQNVAGTLQSNSHLVTMLNDLVIPAVRSQEAPVREQGLLCLGLCCLLDRSLADENLTLFLHCFNKGHEALQTTAIQTIADILESHPVILTGQNETSGIRKAVLKMLSKALKSHDSFNVQSTAAVAFCKLLLVNIIEDEDLLKQAVIAFFDPATRDNSAMKQALSYSLPVYCYSKSQNMQCMAHVAGSVLHALVGMGEEAADEEESISITNAATVIVDWTDSRKIVSLETSSGKGLEEHGNGALGGEPHLILAESAIERALAHGCTREERRACLSLLAKLFISAELPQDRLQKLRRLVVEAMDRRIAGDATSRTALNKFHTTLNKILAEGGDDAEGQVDAASTTSVIENGTAAAEEDENQELQADETRANEADSVLDELLDSADEESTIS